MITAWRLCKAKRAPNAFNGIGASLAPGRWNRLGDKMVYCAESRALAALEILAHVEDRALLKKITFVMISVSIPEECVQIAGKLPTGWDKIPPADASRLYGGRFLDRGQWLALRVPSVVVSGEYNYLLNPEHERFSDVVIKKPQPFIFDQRLA
jgi:RES domain-containing protein